MHESEAPWRGGNVSAFATSCLVLGKTVEVAVELGAEPVKKDLRDKDGVVLMVANKGGKTSGLVTQTSGIYRDVVVGA